MSPYLLGSSPVELGAPSLFDAWRPSQAEALEAAFYSDVQHLGLNLATGTGKSVLAYLIAKTRNQATGGRTVILTHRKGLAEQYRAVFGHDLVEIRGWRNYWSKEEYVAALQEAQNARIVSTTYAYWMNASTYGKGLGGKITTLVCDEASECLTELSNFLSCQFTQAVLNDWGVEWPDHLGADPKAWADWAERDALPVLREEADDKALSEDEQERVNALISKAELLAHMRGKWVCERGERSVYLAKVWPGDEAARYLTRGIERVVYLSATLRPRTLDLIGAAGARFEEYPHPYPWEIRPVYYVPTIRATEKHADDVDWRTWVNRIDQIIERWPEHLGIVHTVSYARAQMFMRQSRNHDVLATHRNNETEKAVTWFRGTQGPHVLVSPVLVAGWDLPEVSWQVLGKVPFPPTADALVNARRQDDPSYVEYQIGQDIVQMAGRIVRGGEWEDRGVSYIIDDTWKWLGPKLMRQGFLSKWFTVEKANVIRT